jgi:hypothetical protein
LLIDCLNHISFEEDRGLILEELKMSSVIEDSMEEKSDNGDGTTKKNIHKSFLSTSNVNRNTETHTYTSKVIETSDVKN